jgi:hypothetical protein
MNFWLREVAGWALVVLGLLIFLMCFQFLTASAIFEAWPLAIVGIVVFRGGIHLLKVAVAARVCLEAAKKGGPAGG